MSSLLSFVVFFVLPVRVALDIASYLRQHRFFNVAYSVLFLTFAIAAFLAGGFAWLGALSLGIAAWYLYRFAKVGVSNSV